MAATATLTIDCTAKTVTVRPLTAEEQADLDTLQAAQAIRQTQETAATTERTDATAEVRDQYAAATAALDAILARNGTFTLTQAGQAIDTLARVQRRMLRLLKAQVG